MAYRSGNVTGHRRKIEGANDDRPLIAFFGLDDVHALELAAQIEAHAAVEHRRLVAAGLRRKRIAAAADDIEGHGHRVDHVVPIGLAHRNAIRMRS